jgi:hypothetical protein
MAETTITTNQTNAVAAIPCNHLISLWLGEKVVNRRLNVIKRKKVKEKVINSAHSQVRKAIMIGMSVTYEKNNKKFPVK